MAVPEGQRISKTSVAFLAHAQRAGWRRHVIPDDSMVPYVATDPLWPFRPVSSSFLCHSSFTAEALGRVAAPHAKYGRAAGSGARPWGSTAPGLNFFPPPRVQLELRPARAA